MAKVVTRAGYSGTPLAQKLGIKPATGVLLVRAPEGFEAELIGLPERVRIARRASTDRQTATFELTIWFVSRRAELVGGIAAAASSMGAGLWIAWPKRASGVVSDLAEDAVREAGLAHGLVDYKVCAINAIWSGLKFARRQAPRGTRCDRPARS